MRAGFESARISRGRDRRADGHGIDTPRAQEHPEATDRHRMSRDFLGDGVGVRQPFQIVLAMTCVAALGPVSRVCAQAPGPVTVKPEAPHASPAGPTPAPAVARAQPKYIVVPTGTRLPLILHNAVSTRSAHRGDPVYLETIFPILADGRIAIPAGSYVSGEITEAKRPGRIHGKGEIRIKLDELILPNGYEASFNATPTDVGSGGNERVTGKEGTIEGDSNKRGDVRTVAQTTVAGSTIGAIAGRSGEAAGLGAGIGAAAGLAAILLTRGPDARLPRGTTLDVILGRPLYLLASKIHFTSPGQASSLAGPSGRQRSRGVRIPFL